MALTDRNSNLAVLHKKRVLESGAFGAGVWEPEMAQASLARNCMTYQPGCWGGKVGLGERFRGNHQDLTGV